MTGYLPSFRGGRSRRLNESAHPNGAYWALQADVEKLRIVQWIGSDQWNRLLDDPRIPDGSSEQQLTMIFRRIHAAIIANPISWRTVENLVAAGMQLDLIDIVAPAEVKQ